MEGASPRSVLPAAPHADPDDDSRWLQAALYLCLLVAQAYYVVRFMEELKHLKILSLCPGFG